MDQEEVDIEIAKLGLKNHFDKDNLNFNGPSEN
jgi:hypothetical protein